ncbi:class I SAM-dependent methyltransferase [Streptomyces sp. NPDC001822]|uniref:class I SAM-dependent methyltransferase n=1 Tax=Streptomyces sp. NPDC001822 TaxID=3364614 RepID=UPI0036CB1604
MTTTTASQEAFLRAFHSEQPAVTAEAFARGRAPNGKSSYEILRDRVAGSRRVLDLGCGDGLLLEYLAASEGRQLAGVDLSPESVALARRRPALTGARLEEGRAQELPFPDDGFDACVSHMALMLMADIEQVAADVARVLAPGGVLACVLGGGAAGGEAHERFGGMLRSALDEAPAARRVPALGDRRTRTREGLDEILGTAGFGAADWETVTIDLSGSAEEVWGSLSGMYDLAPLDHATVTALRESFLAGTAESAGRDGHVACAFRIHVATARLR